MSDSATIQTIKSQTLAVIVEITANPKPTYSIDGQLVAWNEYLRQLQATADWCDRQLVTTEPVELHTSGYTP